jgi:predicted ester cyclase
MADAKEIVRRVEEAWARNDLKALDDLIVSNVVNHDAPPGLPPGLEGAKADHSMFMASFPDRQQTIEQIVGEGDLVAVRRIATATHSGASFFGVPPTSKKVRVESISLYRVANGKVVEHWGLSDGLGLMMQLGAFPAPASA